MTDTELPSTPGVRVLHLVPTLGGGGAERQLGYLAVALAALGADVHVGYLRDGPNLKLLEDTDVRLHPLHAAGSHDLRLPWIVRRLLRKVRPDVIQTWLPQMDVLGGFAARLNGIPWILSERSSSSAYPGGWKVRARKILGKGATAIVANSAIGLEYWRDAASSTVQRTIRNIVPLDNIAASEFSSQERSGLAPEGTRFVVAAGRLQAEKNWGAYIDALDIALQTLPDVHALIFGDGELRELLAQRIARSPHSNRIFVKGYTDDLWKWLKIASCYVSVSHFEGSPNVVLEAIACKVPVVVSNIPGHREILPDTAAEFVSPDSAESIAKAIIETLSHPEAMAGRAQDTFRVVQQRSASAIAAEYLSLYREIS